MEKPVYGHDCTNCLFIERYANYDCYVCLNTVYGSTVVLRYGNEVPDYVSYSFTLIETINFESNTLTIAKTILSEYVRNKDKYLELNGKNKS